MFEAFGKAEASAEECTWCGQLGVQLQCELQAERVEGSGESPWQEARDTLPNEGQRTCVPAR